MIKSKLNISIILFSGALIVRLFVTSIFMEPIRTYDRDGYLSVTKQFLETGEIQQGRYYARRAPMYPLVLAGWMAIFGGNDFSLRILHTILSATVCLLIYFIGAEIFGQKIGQWAFFLSVFYPHLIFYSGIISSEGLFVPLLALIIFLFLRVSRGFSIFTLLSCGVVLGIAALTRPVILLFIPFIYVWGYTILKGQCNRSSY